MYQRACGDGTLPLDFMTEVATEGLLRFSPRNPRVPFLGRQEEMAALHAFLTSEPGFAWWVVTGGGGAGKTRLARQLCMQKHAEGWRTGFLPGQFKAADATKGWQPQVPTLIVADYVMRNVAEVHALAARLAHGRGRYQHPVRLLLLEREAGKPFDDAFLGTDTNDKGAILDARYSASALGITDLSDDELWALVEDCPWRDDGARVCIPRGGFFERFGAMDELRRALVAMILADAVAAAPDSAGFGGLEKELHELLVRDRDHWWPGSLGVKGNGSVPRRPTL